MRTVYCGCKQDKIKFYAPFERSSNAFSFRICIITLTRLRVGL